jgi:hypothetical protein
LCLTLPDEQEYARNDFSRQLTALSAPAHTLLAR